MSEKESVYDTYIGIYEHKAFVPIGTVPASANELALFQIDKAIQKTIYFINASQQDLPRMNYISLRDEETNETVFYLMFDNREEYDLSKIAQYFQNQSLSLLGFLTI